MPFDKELSRCLAILLFAICCLHGHAGETASPFKILDEPQWLFPGRMFRICLEQPEDGGKMTAEVPPELELFDTWDQGRIQRFYFRTLAPGEVCLTFSSAAGRLELPVSILPWSAAAEPRTLGKIKLPRLWPMQRSTAAFPLKQERTLHDDAAIAKLAQEAPSTLPRTWYKMSDEEIYNIVPGPTVARTCLIVLGSLEGGGVGKGCPVCGTDIYKGRSGFYPWIFDSKNHPWKVGCPNCNTWFPSNDWHKGDMHSGEFPDDGFGCEPKKQIKDKNGRPWRWPFIAYYHQWQAYMKNLTPGIIQTARAYRATGDKRYAHICAIALLRYAESMVDMGVNLKHRKIPNRNGVYNWPVGAPVSTNRVVHSFLYIQPNWDTSRIENCARAWDLIFDQLGEDRALLQFARDRHHPEFKTMEDFRRFIEMGVLRVPIQAAMDNAISRNYPQQEVTAATLALGLGTPDIINVADWLLNARGTRFALSNEYYIDGSAHESPSYNGIQLRDLPRLFETLDKIRDQVPEQYVPPRFVSPINDPKFRLQYDFPLDFSLIGRTYAQVGDTGKAGRPSILPQKQGYPVNNEGWERAFRLTGDPRFAQALHGPNGRGIQTASNPELAEQAREIALEKGWQVEIPSNILDGYGHATLRSGEGLNQRALWLRYAQMAQHAHPDMLTYGLAAMQRSLLPELGYPEGWTYAGHWEKNWGTHYGTKIVGSTSKYFTKGELTTFVATPPFQIATAEAESLRKKGDWRQRTNLLVDVDAEHFYAVSLERVAGGQEQIFSFHGPDGEVETTGLELVPQKGTAAGPDVPYKDLTGAAETDGELSCLALLREPQTAAPKAPWSLLYKLRDQEDYFLRMTHLGPTFGELTLAKGRAPGGRSAYDITWALLKNKATDNTPLNCQYLTILEPYRQTPAIQNIERLDCKGKTTDSRFSPIAFRITTGDYTDTIILQNAPGNLLVVAGIHCDGEAAFWRERQGQLQTLTLVQGTTLKREGIGISLPSPTYEGKIQACNWQTAEITIAPCPPQPGCLQSRHVRIHNENGSSSSYQILKATPRLETNTCTLKFRLDPRIGEGFVNPGKCAEATVFSDTLLRLNRFNYYHGKTLANEDGSVLRRIKDIGGANIHLLPSNGQTMTKEQIVRAYSDRDNDKLTRFAIYDYGPGDRITIKNFITINFSPGTPK